MPLFSRPRPVSALADLAYVIRTPVPHKLGIMGVSAAITFVLIYSLVHDFTPKPVHRSPIIIYVKQWPKSRTLAQIEAQQKIDAPIEAAAAAKEQADDAKADADRRAQFKRAQVILNSYGIK